MASDIAFFGFVFFLVWWLVIFTILPWGNRPDESEGFRRTGVPKTPHIGKKFIIATLISLILTSLIRIFF